MSNVTNPSEFENGLQDDSNYLPDKHSIILEFALYDRKIETKSILTGLGLKLFFGSLLLMLETLGNYLLFCMLWYEKFGMDSKKRTVTNQLLSRMIFALILFNIIFMPLFFGALLIPYSKYFIFKGFLNYCLQHICLLSVLFIFSNWFSFLIIGEYAYLTLEFGIYRILMHTLLTLAEMVIFKILYMYKFSVIAAMDEYFLTNFLTSFNIMINFGSTIIRVWLNENRKTRMYFRKFSKPIDVYKRIPWP